MRISLQLAALTTLALFGTLGCEGEGSESTITEAEFLAQFEEIYCGEHDGCIADSACPDPSSVLNTDCFYDAIYAHDCLAGDYSCDISGGAGAEVVVMPTICDSVYDCDATTTTGGGTTTEPTGTTTGGEPSI